MINNICIDCILDTTIPEIEFNNTGVCNFCELHEKFEQKFPLKSV